MPSPRIRPSNRKGCVSYALAAAGSCDPPDAVSCAAEEVTESTDTNTIANLDLTGSLAKSRNVQWDNSVEIVEKELGAKMAARLCRDYAMSRAACSATPSTEAALVLRQGLGRLFGHGLDINGRKLAGAVFQVCRTLYQASSDGGILCCFCHAQQCRGGLTGELI